MKYVVIMIVRFVGLLAGAAGFLHAVTQTPITDSQLVDLALGACFMAILWTMSTALENGDLPD